MFKYLNNFDLNGNEYEMALNPIRYRHIIIIQILKQYIRENLFVGELEIELTTPMKKKTQYNRMKQDQTDHSPSKSSPSAFSNGQSLGHFSHFILALQDNQGKTMKRKSVQIPNFFKVFKDL